MDDLKTFFVRVEYEVEATDAEQANAILRKQLERDDEIAFGFHEDDRFIYAVRDAIDDDRECDHKWREYSYGWACKHCGASKPEAEIG